MSTHNTKYLVPSKFSVLVPTSTPAPTISSPTEVLIRLKAVAINPADIKSIDQGHRVSSWPFVPGLDGAGVVEAVGDGVKRFVVGDEVLALFSPGDRGASFQEWAVVEERVVARKPAYLTWEEGASLGTSFMTAIMALGIGLQTPLPFLKDGSITGFKPSTVLILGGSSALGAAAIKLLRLALPECKILTTSSPKHHDHLITLGADKAFNRSSPSLIEDVKNASPESKGVEAIIDAVGAGATQRHVFEALDIDGPKRYAQVWTGDEEIEVPDGLNSVMFRGRDMMKLQGGENIMLALQGLLENHKFYVPLPVKNVGEGLKGLENGLDLMRQGVSGEKLVVSV